MGTQFEYSAGGIVVKDDKVLVIKTKNLKNETVYTFPKGHIEKNEDAEESAIREVEEETGVKCKIKKELKTVEYWFVRDKKRVHKKVKWYLMEPVGETDLSKLKHCYEVDEVMWVKLDEVEKLLSYKSDKELVKLLK